MATELAMSDFTSGFWSLFVMVVTIVSIAGCGLLLVAMSKRRAKPTAASAAGSGTKTTQTTGHVWDGDLAEYWREGFKKFQPGLTLEYHLPTATIAVPAIACSGG